MVKRTLRNPPPTYSALSSDDIADFATCYICYVSQLYVKICYNIVRQINYRESACLSRKKKKEYVTSLELRLATAETELAELRWENATLKARLSLMESKNRSNGNVSVQQSNRTIAIKPRKGNQITWPCLKSASNLFNASLNTKKNVAILFAMMFTVSLNIGGFG